MSRYPDGKEGMTNEINPNRGGPIHSAPDTIDPRFNARGRADSNGLGTFKDRLRDQVENGKAWETAISPEINIEAVIEPPINDIGLKGIEWGQIIQWNDISEKIPETMSWYLVVVADGERDPFSTMAFLDSIDSDGECIWLVHNDSDQDVSEWAGVTHWAFVPDPPSGVRSVIEPSQELGRAWLKGLEFGGEHD